MLLHITRNDDELFRHSLVLHAFVLSLQVRWEIRGVPPSLLPEVQSLFLGDDFQRAYITILSDHDVIDARNYALYASPLSRHFFDAECLEALQQGVAVLVDARSGTCSSTRHR